MVNISPLLLLSEGDLRLVLWASFPAASCKYGVIRLFVGCGLERVLERPLRFHTATNTILRLLINNHVDLLHDHFAVRARDIKAVWICGTELLGRGAVLLLKNWVVEACGALPRYGFSALA